MSTEERPLTDDELKKLRELLRVEPNIVEIVERDKAYTLVVAGTKRVAAWVVVVAGAVTAGWSLIEHAIRRAAGG